MSTSPRCPSPKKAASGSAEPPPPEVAIGIPVPGLVETTPMLLPSRNEARSWSSGVCDCCDDPVSCVAVIFCVPNVVGQLAQRTWRRPGLCVLVATCLWIGIAARLTTYVLPSTDYVRMKTWSRVTTRSSRSGHWEHAAGATGSAGVDEEWVETASTAASVASLAGLMACLLTCFVRNFIRRRDRIPSISCSCCCDLCDDCMCATWCLPCVQAQLMRHEGLTEGRYAVCSRDGNPPARNVSGGRHKHMHMHV